MRNKIWDKYVLAWISEEEKREMDDLIFKYEFKKSEISNKKSEIFSDKNLSDEEKKENFLEYKKNLSEELKNISKNIEKISDKIWWLTKNILKNSSFEDEMIWSWKDSLVYDSWDWYVYKESVISREVNEKSLEYLQKKYKILNTYLWDIIPKSYSVFWESVDDLWDWKRDFNWINIIRDKVITIQKKINWKDLSEVSFEEKMTNEKLKNELEKAHSKYTLLRMYLWKIRRKMDIAEWWVDLKMDLWAISDIDTLYLNNPQFVSEKVKSPNIMWDEIKEKIYFIDFDEWFWTWDMEKVYDQMMSKKSIDQWKNILESFDLED